MTSLKTPKLSTYHKGDLFEQKVFDFLSRELEAGNLYFAPQFTTIQRKPKYFSREREDYIVFDISIEVRLPGFDAPSMIMLVECKNYSSTIPINDVEEFSSKISQVTGHNAKGMLVTASAFQASALNFARNKGMAVIRYLDEGNFTWELSRSLLMGAINASERRSKEILNALIAPSFQPAIYTTYAATPQGYTNTLAGVFQSLFSDLRKVIAGYQQLIQPQPTSKHRVAFLSLQQIEARATEVLQRTGYTNGRVDLEKIIDHERMSSGLEVIFSGPSRTALGGISFSPPEIQIFTDDKDAPLARFTLAHELGHYYLGHGAYLTRERLHASDMEQYDSDRIPRSDVGRLEWQANAFASFLLMPTMKLLERLALLTVIYNIRNRGHGLLYLDHQPVNYRSFRLVSDNLSHHFHVSKTAIRLRLSRLGLLVDARTSNRPPPGLPQIASQRQEW
ncbi:MULTISPECIES: ImmA/IrrE family metallo-endopeptidase [Pseudomonas]|uniref:ImmA/IrrE family metallo-endopeptidase n=1 Tax=Pseudomonas TaxID=286 RepID=UPI0020125CAC|nr:ImmA/IrrE family metallo-endopeptidase [Pseudomonas juntendi]